MSRAGTALIVLVALAISITTVSLASQAAPDPESATLTEYLHNHRLPAVGAQVTVGEDGARTVMLYGFVATQRGFDDAAQRTRDFLHDPYVRIVNRVKIEPEMLALHKQGSQATSSSYSSQESSGAPAPALADNTPPPADVGDIQQYQAQNQSIDPYGMQGQSTTITGSTLLLPLIGGLLTYGLLNSFGPSYYSPPSYYVPPSPPPYYPPPYMPHRHYHGRPFHSTFMAPPAPAVRPFMPHFASVAPPPPRYLPPPHFSPPPPIQHSYFGGYRGSFGGGSPGFGGGFGGGYHGGHR